MAPVDARVIRYFVLTVMLAFVVGVLPLLRPVRDGGRLLGAMPRRQGLGLGLFWCRR